MGDERVVSVLLRKSLTYPQLVYKDPIQELEQVLLPLLVAGRMLDGTKQLSDGVCDLVLWSHLSLASFVAIIDGHTEYFVALSALEHPYCLRGAGRARPPQLGGCSHGPRGVTGFSIFGLVCEQSHLKKKVGLKLLV